MEDEILVGESAALSTVLNDPTNEIVAHLAKNTIAEGATITLLFQLTECDFPGYAPFPIINPDVMNTDDEFVGEAVSDPVMFQAAAELVTPQNATVVYLTWKRGVEDAKLWRAYPLKGGFAFEVPGRKFGVQFRFNSLTEGVVPDDLGVPGQV